MKRILLPTVAVAVACGLLWARQEKGGQEPQMPMPSREHELLKRYEGNWDYLMKFKTDDGKDTEIKGSEVCTMVGGFWIVFDNKAPDMMGMSWHGHGTLGYDPDKKKYVGAFIHSMSPYPMHGEGTIDAAGKLTMIWQGKEPHSDKPHKMREVSEFKDKDTAVMTMYDADEGGEEHVHFTIESKRRK